MIIDKQFSKTRIAPTPSGFLHLGNVLSFAVTASLARQAGASIVLRIDDLDHERVNREYVQDIFETLQFLEIPWDDGPKNIEEYEKEYSQIHRLPLYQQMLDELKEGNHLFACDCSRSKLIKENGEAVYTGNCRNKQLPLVDGYNWRLYTDPGQLTMKSFDKGTVTEKLSPEMQDFIVRKKDNFPAYQLASVCDDIYFGVDFIVRGEDLYPSTLSQLYLSSILQNKKFSDTVFYHHPLLKESSGNKLSKSAGSTSIHRLRKQGKPRAEVFALIATLAGIREDVNDWQSLAAFVLQKD